MSKNNIIFISEYNAPKKRVKKIFEKKVNLTGFQGNYKIKKNNRIEKLYVI
jgi:hypothetical protein